MQKINSYVATTYVIALVRMYIVQILGGQEAISYRLALKLHTLVLVTISLKTNSSE